MADDIRTNLKFTGDSKAAEATINSIIKSLERAAAAQKALFDNSGKGSFLPTGAVSEAERARSSLLSLAQASARLQSAQGDLAGAQRTLQTALANVAKESTASLRAQTQLTQIGNQIAASSDRAASAAARRASAEARLQTIQGNLVGAERTLKAALDQTNGATEQAIRLSSQLATVQNRLANNTGTGFLLSPAVREAGESIQQAGFALEQYVTGPLASLSSASVKSALDIDRQVNALKALTGSAEAAEARFAALFALAQNTPGLTTSTAAALDAQLRLAAVSQQTIDRFLQTAGRLNALQPLGDPQEFANNLRQLVDQGFERADLKQVVNRNPIAGELIKQIFGVDNPTNAEAIRSSAQRLGIRTAEQFFAAFATAGQNNARLQAATESIAVQLEKTQDRLTVALRPIGLTLLDIIVPAVEAGVPAVAALANAFAGLPQPIQLATVAFGGLLAALGPGLNLFGGFLQALQVFQVAKLAQTAQAISAAGTASTAAAASVGGLTTSLAGLRAALVATSTFLFTTPAGLALVAAAAGVAALAYVALSDAQAEFIEKADALKFDDLSKQVARVDQLRQQITQADALTGSQAALNDEQARFSALLAALTPQQQAVINSLGDQKNKVDELQQSLRENLAAQQDLARAQQVILVAAVAARQQEIDQTKQQIEQLQRELQVRNELLKSGQQTQTKVIGAEFGEALIIVENLSEAERGLANERIKADEALKKLNSSQAENLAKLKATLPVLNQTEASLLAEYQAGRLTTDQIQRLKAALDAARTASGGVVTGANQVSGALDQMAVRAADAKAALDAVFKTGDSSALRSQITGRLNEIAAAAAKAGTGAKGAVEGLNKALADQQDPLKNLLGAYKAIETAQKAVNEKAGLTVAPRAAGGGRGRRTVGQAEARDDQRELRILEQQQELANRRQSELLKTALQDRLISLEQFTQEAIGLEEALLAAKVRLFTAEEEAARKSARTKSEADAKVAEVKLRRAQAEQEAESRINSLRIDQRRAVEKAEEDHQRRIIEIQEIGRRSQEAAIRAAAERGAIGLVEAEKAIQKLEQQRFDERARLLQDELNKLIENKQERQRILDEIKKLNAEKAASDEEATRRTVEAQQREIEQLKRYQQERDATIADRQRAELDTAASATQLALQRGQIRQRQAAAADQQRVREEIEIRLREREREIERQAEQLKKEAQQARAGAEEIIRIEQEKNLRLQAERQRAALEKQISAESERAAQLSPGFGEETAGIIAGIEAALGRQLTLWEANRVAAEAYAVSLQEKLTAAAEQAKNVMGNLQTATQAAVQAFVDTGSLKAAGKALLKTLAQPYLEYAILRAKFHAAAAIGSLAALDFRGAALHGLAAAGFAALAGVGTALLNSGGGGASSGAGGQTPGGQPIRKDKRVIEQGGPLPGPPQPQPIIINLRADVKAGMLEIVRDDINLNGSLRQIIHREVKSAT